VRKTLFVIAKAAQQAMGESVQAELILGNWSPFHARALRPSLFDPDEIEYVVGVAQGVILAVYEVAAGPDGTPWHSIVDPDNPDRWRVRFHGVRTLRHLEGTPSPVVWSRGQGTPVRVADSSLLTDGDAPAEQIESASGPARRAVLGQVVVTAAPDGTVTVDAPAGTVVTVRTAAAATAMGPLDVQDAKGPDSGAYYTPRALVEQTVAAVFDALGANALQRGDVSITDPSLGTGAFLNAAMALAKEYATPDAPKVPMTGPLVLKIIECLRERLEGTAA